MILASAQPAYALRPFDGELAEVPEARHFELELGPIEPIVAGAERTLLLPQFQLDYGLRPEWAAVLRSRDTFLLGGSEAGSYRLEHAMAGVKGVVRPGSLQGEPGPSLAVEGGVLLPALGAPSPGTVGAAAAGIISQRWGPVVLGGDLEAFYSPEGHPGAMADLIVEGPSWLGLRPVAELQGEDILGEAPTVAALVGGILQMDEDISVDAGVRAGFGGPEVIFELRMGLTWGFMLTSAR
jgi:hypothetical protein